MPLREEIGQGENVALEFREARLKDSLKCLKTVVAFANGRGRRTVAVGWSHSDLMDMRQFAEAK